MMGGIGDGAFSSALVLYLAAFFAFRYAGNLTSLYAYSEWSGKARKATHFQGRSDWIL